MENKNMTAVDFIKEQLSKNEDIRWRGSDIDSIYKQAKQMEKDKERQKLIGLLDWMNKVAADNPMAFETDHDDIVEMYLNGFYGK